MLGRRLLEALGHRVDIAVNGREAVARVKDGRIDLVFMDIEMPVMDGIEATAVIRQSTVGRDVPICALTAHATPAYRDRCYAAGMNAWLTKPIDRSALRSAIDEALRCVAGAEETEDMATDEPDNLNCDPTRPCATVTPPVTSHAMAVIPKLSV